jgi:glutamate-ammonia-ligase adenylyltransferase
MGPLAKEFMAIAKNAWHRAGQHVDLYAKIDNMLERIRRERSSGSEFLDLKTGRGGIIEAEFLVQALQMRNAIWEPNWTGAVDHLREVGQFSESEARALKGAYEFLRGCESVLRRYENKSVSALPAGQSEQGRFVHRLGFKNIEAFTQKYTAARSSIQGIYGRRIRQAPP